MHVTNHVSSTVATDVLLELQVIHLSTESNGKTVATSCAVCHGAVSANQYVFSVILSALGGLTT